MPDTPELTGPEPFRVAVVAVLTPELLEELARVEEQCRTELAEALAAKGRAAERPVPDPLPQPEQDVGMEQQVRPDLRPVVPPVDHRLEVPAEVRPAGLCPRIY